MTLAESQVIAVITQPDPCRHRAGHVQNALETLLADRTEIGDRELHRALQRLAKEILQTAGCDGMDLMPASPAALAWAIRSPNSRYHTDSITMS